MIERGEIYYADLNPVKGSEQGGIRPVLVIQNDVGNRFSPTVIVAAITSTKKKTNLPTHIVLPKIDGLAKRSIVLLEQIRTIDKSRLSNKIAVVPESVMHRIDRALGVSIGFYSENE